MPKVQRRHSLFLKIIFIFILFWLVLNFLLINYFHAINKDTAKERLVGKFEQVIDYLLEEIGAPPDLEKAKKLAKVLPIELRIQGNGVEWQSSPNIPDQYKNSRYFGKYKVGWARGTSQVIAEESGYTYTFIVHFSPMNNGSLIHLVGLLALLALMVLVAYLILRWVLHPLKDLAFGVSKITEGDFDVQVPESKRRKDELGDLAKSFNQMTSQIKNLMQAKDQLLTDVSHELRSPLARMKTELSLMDQDNRQESLMEEVNSMNEMVEDVLESERIRQSPEELIRDKFDLRELIEKSITPYQKRIPGVEFKCEIDAVPHIGDERRLGMVVKNLLDNAQKHTDVDGKPIFVKLDQVQRNGQLQNRIVVRDWGAGLDESELQSIFEPFYRVDKSRSKKTGGYGLGLSLVKRVVEIHGGTVDAESSTGKGLVVVVLLPS